MKEDEPNLIIKYLQGTLSGEEKDAFYDWVNMDEANKKLFFEVKAIYEAALSNNRSINTMKSWQRLLKKKQQKPHTYKLWKRIASYAAVGIIAVSLTSLFYKITKDVPEAIVTRYIGGDGLEADVVVLPDGTRVSLGSKTTFHYNPDYGQSKRNVYLEGEAYFEVSAQKEKPFIVHINGMTVEALGTAFNVMAYPGDSLFVTTLLEGSVRLIAERLSHPVILKPDRQFVYNRNRHTAYVHQVDASDYVAWTTGYYHFSDQTLQAILHRLSYVYGITFDLKSQQLNDAEFTGTFYRGQSAKDLMEIINLSVPLRYKIDDHHVTIYE
jgi:ferric-dicitrate binding protein FerR (iron transport regulator)